MNTIQRAAHQRREREVARLEGVFRATLASGDAEALIERVRREHVGPARVAAYVAELQRLREASP